MGEAKKRTVDEATLRSPISLGEFIEAIKAQVRYSQEKHPFFAKRVAEFDGSPKELVRACLELKANNDLLDRAKEANAMALAQEELFEAALEWHKGKRDNFIEEMAQVCAVCFRAVNLGLETMPLKGERGFAGEAG